MVLEFDYGVNTDNRFLQFVDHDEEPEDFLAAQAQEEKKLASKDVKQTSTKKVTTKTTTTTSVKTNKENFTAKTSSAEQRRQQQPASTAVFSDNNQQTRPDSARGARGGARRGGPPYDGAGRGRSQRFNKFEGKGPASDSTSFEQGGEGWSTEVGARGNRGRGGQRQGNFEGGRGRGRGGRGNFNNRNEDGPQQDDSNWQQTSESNFDQDVSATERSFDADNNRRGNRGTYRGRAHRNYSDREGEGQEDYRANRRQFDRQPRSFVSGVKPIEKKDGEGAHNWGNPTENPEEHPISDEITETTAQPSSTAGKDWAAQMDEAEKQMTLDEYKKQIEERKRAHQEKLPQLNRRVAGEGEDPKQWQKFEQEYRKRNDDDEEEEEEEEGDEENESGEEYEEEQSGKKKLITIPLRFKPIDIPRGAGGSRGGQRRPGGNRYRSERDEQQRATSPNQGQANDEQQRSSYRGARAGGEQRRSNRGGGGGYRSARADPNAPALDNPEDFPTLPKQ